MVKSHRPVRIEYRKDVPADGDQPGRVKGEAYGLESVALAERLHPHATVVAYTDTGEAVTDHTPKAVRDTREAKASEKQADASDDNPTEPVIVAETDYPKWYRDFVAKAGEDGAVEPLFEGETQRVYLERIGQAPEA